MMYQIFCDGNLLHDVNIEDLKLYDPKMTLEQNNIGSFEFKIYPSNPYFNSIKKLKSIVTVYQQGDIIFRGRPIEFSRSVNNSLQVYCEGELAFFIDSIQLPYDWSGSVNGLFEMFINNHNEQVETEHQFKIGTITVTDPNDYIVRADSEYSTTWDCIKSKFVDMLGGYLVVRHEKDGNYIDYLADFTTLNAQHVTFGENMLDVKRTEDGGDIATVLIPLGAKNEENDERLTIEDVNEGKIYIENAENIKKYGRITKILKYDDVTEPTNLLRKGTEALAQMGTIISSIEISALDMASINEDIRNFKMHSKIKVTSQFHGIDDYFVPLKMSISLFKQSSNKITLNGAVKTLTDSTAQNSSTTNNIVTIVENINNDYQVNIPNQIATLEKELTSLIEQTSETITQEVSEKYYNKDDTDVLISEVSTTFEQNKEYFEMQFTNFSQDLNDLLNDTNANFEDIKKFIRFEDGNIILGQIGNEFSLKITKERISFMQGAYEVAYISNTKLYITYVEVLNSLQIGLFGFMPRANGSLAFVKIGG